jgi:hypothetical protein
MNQRREVVALLARRCPLLGGEVGWDAKPSFLGHALQIAVCRALVTNRGEPVNSLISHR